MPWPLETPEEHVERIGIKPGCVLTSKQSKFLRAMERIMDANNGDPPSSYQLADELGITRQSIWGYWRLLLNKGAIIALPGYSRNEPRYIPAFRRNFQNSVDNAMRLLTLHGEYRAAKELDDYFAGRN